MNETDLDLLRDNHANERGFGRLISSASHMEKMALWLVCLSVALTVIVMSVGLLPDLATSFDRDKMGLFGDFVGGTLNPLLTFITFLTLIFTIVLQQRELLLAREEYHRTANAMERENFEATVFRLSSLIREGVNSIDIMHDGKSYVGTDAFKLYFDQLKDVYEDMLARAGGGVDPYKEAYDTVYETYGHDFSHYYRLLYNTYRWIKKSKDLVSARGEEAVRSMDIDFYAKIVRAQISDYELLVFYYNFLSGRSDNFKDLLVEFNLFDNMRGKALLTQGHAGLAAQALARMRV